MASTKKLSTTLHRSRQKIPFPRREHLHDGLRMMVSDIPREHGCLIQRSTTNVLIAEADECEEELYKAHEYTNRKAIELRKQTIEVEKEYEQRGEGLSFDEFIAQSRSFGVMKYQIASEKMIVSMGKLQEVTANAVEKDNLLKKEISELQAEFVDAAMHCRRLTEQEFETLDVRVKLELDDGDHSHVVVPFRTADDLCHSRWTPHFEADGKLESYVNNGGEAFVGISCDVHSIQIAGCLTLLHNPCLPPRLGPGTRRLGRELRILFLADNNLGAYNLRSILKGMRHSTELEVFHCHSNGIGEVGEGSSQQNPDQDSTDALSAMKELAEIVQVKRCPLRVMGLSGNRIGAAGLSRLMPGIALNGSITILDLSENSLGVSGANHIAKCLVTNRTLQTLNLNNTMLTHYGLKAICSALQFNPTLRILYTLRNVGPAARQDIFKSMEENTTMEVMHVFLDTPWINPNYLGAESAPEMRRFEEITGGVPFEHRVSLIRAFKTYGEIANASEAALNALPGMKVYVASTIYHHFHTPAASFIDQRPGTSSSGHRSLSTDAALALLESKGYYEEVEDPWNIVGCLEQECKWEPVHAESFRLQFTRKKARTAASESSMATMMIPSAGWNTPDRPSTAETRLTTPGTPDKGSQEGFERAASNQTERSDNSTSVGRSGSQGGSQVEERLKAAEQKRFSTKGVTVLWTNEAMKPVDLSAKPVAQSWGPPRKPGANKITSEQIWGLGIKGTVKKYNIQCSFCASRDRKAGVGEYGHEDFECPVNFFQTTGELMPGFDQYGCKIEDLWQEGESEIRHEAKVMWDKLEAKGYFTEPAEGVPILERKFKSDDVTKSGKVRRLWEERGAFTSKDASLRKQMFESTRRSGEALFTHGKEQLDAFLRERSGLSDSGNEARSPPRMMRQDTYKLPGADDMSMAMRARLHLTDGGNDMSHRADVHMSDHGGVKFIPSALKRKELFLQKIRNNHLSDVQDFVEGKYGTINPNDKDPRSGATALIEAAQAGHKRILKLLMKNKADVNIQDRKGNTCLHYASTYHYQAIVDYLLNHGADMTITNSAGKPCLQGM